MSDQTEAQAKKIFALMSSLEGLFLSAPSVIAVMCLYPSLRSKNVLLCPLQGAIALGIKNKNVLPPHI